MEHHYTNWLHRILEAAADLETEMHGNKQHAFWLHIDGDKLDKAARLLESMVNAINDETETA